MNPQRTARSSARPARMAGPDAATAAGPVSGGSDGLVLDETGNYK